MTMISAKEARKQSQGQKIDCEMSKIEARIKVAISEGERSICIGQFISLEAKQQLEELGYDVKYGNQYNESYTSIK